MRTIHPKFESAYRELYPFVLGYFKKHVHSIEDAKELTQEVFACYLDALMKGKTIKNYGAWMNQTSQYIFSNYKRLAWNTNVECNETKIGQVQSSDTYQSIELGMLLRNVLTQEVQYPSNLIFILIGVYKLSRSEVAKVLAMHRYQVEYLYNKSCRVVKEALKKRGIKSLEDIS